MIKTRLFRVTLLALIAGLLFCISPGMAAAFDTPVVPHSFYGDLLINGSPAPVDTKVEAKGVGVKTTGFNPLFTKKEAGKYGEAGPLGAKLIVQGTLVEGTILTFYVNDCPTGQTHAWHSGEITKLDLALNCCQLTTVAGPGGTISQPETSPLFVVCGTSIHLVAVPNACYEFVNWTGAPEGKIVSPTSAETDIIVDADYEITANFAIKQFNLTVASDEHGTVTSPGEGTKGPYNCGTEVNLVADPDDGYVFSHWSGAPTGKINCVTCADTYITIDGSYSIMANFVAGGDGGGGTTTGGGGGGGGGTPTLSTDIFGNKDSFYISSVGRILEPVTIISPDGKIRITIPKYTFALDKFGKPLSSLSVDEDPSPACPVPEDKRIIGLAYSFKPDGATFSPPITIVFKYNPDELPEGILEEDLIIAFCDEESGEWMSVSAVVDDVKNTITAQISHFSTYAIIAQGIEVPVTPVVPTAEPTVPAKPKPAAFSLKSMSVSPAETNIGETVSVSITVTNTGGEAGKHDVILTVDGIKEGTKAVTLNPGENKEISFTVSKDKPGTYRIECEGLTGSFVVKEAAAVPETTPPVTTGAAPIIEEEGIQWWVWLITAIVVLIAAGIGWYLYSRRQKPAA